MRIIESPLMEVAVTSFRGEAADPERWSVLPKVTQRVSGRSGTQTHASESRTGISATRLGIQWLQGSGVSDQLLPLHSLQPDSHLGHTCWSLLSPAAQTGSCPHVPFHQSWKSKTRILGPEKRGTSVGEIGGWWGPLGSCGCWAPGEAWAPDSRRSPWKHP